MTATPEPAPLILVVEDAASVCRLLVDALTRHGFHAITAEHGLHGLLSIDRMDPKPDLVLLDIMMPELDGLELMKALRSHPETRAIPVILVTARTDAKTIADGISAGARGYITKPFTIAELIGKVRKALKG